MSIFIPTSTIEYYNLPQREIQVTERYSSMSMRIFFGTLRTRIHKCALFYYCHKNLAWAPNPISGSWVKVTQAVTEP